MSVEREIQVIARMTDLTGLDVATKIEHHLQAEIKGPRGKIRVRRTIDRNNNYTYVETIKVPIDNNGVIEDNIDITKERLNSFIKIAGKYTKKTRFSFPISKVSLTTNNETKTIPVEGIFYEVDVYLKPDSTEYCEYCRIEVEYQAIDNYIKTNFPEIISYDLKVTGIDKLPFKPVDIFDPTKANEEQNKLLDYLFQKVYISEVK